MTTNPYTYDRPIADRSRFLNRRFEITRVSSRIAAHRPQSVSIVGDPRTGKTSLLNWLCDAASHAEYLEDPARYVYLLLRLKDAPPGGPDVFFERVGEALRDAGEEAAQPTYEGFIAGVERLMRRGKKLVLFCDDFHAVTQNQAFPLEFFSFLRSVANNHDVAYVTTSAAALHRLCASPALEESPFFNIFTTVTLRPFRPEDAHSLVQGPAAAAGAPFGEEVGWILDLGGCLPYLLQLTASLAFEGLSDGGLSREALAERAFARAKDFLQMLWDTTFSPAHQDALRAVCEGRAVEQGLRYAAEDLASGGYLRKDGEDYAFGPGLLRRFVEHIQKRSLWRRLVGE